MAETSLAERGLRDKPAAAAGGGRRRRRLQPQGLHWILPALVLSVGLIYYCIWYTAVISTWDWDGIDPNPERVGAENYIRIAQDPIFWKTIQHTIVFFVVTFVLQTALGLIFAVLLHSKVKLAVVYKVIIFIKAISQSHVGYGAALSIILLVLALVMALILQVRGGEKRVVR
jgi:raffinose/stachyose/melibiose transport system permease protein